MRVEGWLQLKVGRQPFNRTYVVIDGFILRAFTEQPTLSEILAPASFILDLRMIDSLKPEDIHSPSGPCVLTAKGRSPKSATVAPEAAISSDEGNWWMPVISSAVPDRACAASIRGRFRKGEIALALMSENAMQPSAHQMSDAYWRKLRCKEKAKKAAGLARKTSASSPKGTPRGPTTPRSVDVNSVLAKARDRSLNKGQEAETPGGDADGHAEPSSALAVVAAPASAGTSHQQSGGQPASPEDAATPPLDIMTSAPEEAAGSTSGAEPAADEGSSGLGAFESLEEGGGWWFIKHSDDSVTGPHPPAEMRRRYLKGLVTHATMVRFVPFDEAPAADEHVGQPFSELQELCSASGPPFMEKVMSPRR
mmetsp:Transcript_40022/g.105792  ORF Transcript_40022/g.105792 Transcript_40022/m.105792 type:complete len:366 (+) Transcript_40022:67-1164(+)